MEYLLVQDAAGSNGAKKTISTLGRLASLAGLLWQWAIRRTGGFGPLPLVPVMGGTTSAADRSRLPERLSQEMQWDRAAGIVKEGVARVETVRGLQRSAEQQLDAAAYALQSLLAELSVVVSMPAGAAAPRERSQIHQVSTSAFPVDRQGSALAA